MYNQNLTIYSCPIDATNFFIALNNEIGEPSEYSELIAVLRFANEHDNIEIEINNNGGCLDTALQIRNAIIECKATVTTCLNVNAHSSASIIFLSGHNYKVGDYASMLVHEGFTGLGGKPSDLKQHFEFGNKQLQRVVKDVYADIITESEMEKVLNGYELILDDKQIVERLSSKRNKQMGENKDIVDLTSEVMGVVKNVVDEYVGKKLTEQLSQDIVDKVAADIVSLLIQE